MVTQKPAVYYIGDEADNPDEQCVVNNFAEDNRLWTGQLVVIPKTVFTFVAKTFAG
jgi:hypothetical protein